MATGGIFQLITNDGKQDRMLMATALLNKRLLEIERLRSLNPQIKDPTPTLVDIERTHILFTNAHFKPFCAIGYEYNKVNVQAGGARLGATGVQFSIPQFGDFFSDMVFHVILGSVSATNINYWTNPANSPADGAELIAYVNYFGQALFQNISFTVNGNPLDQYNSEVMNFHNKFFVTPNKKIGWDRNVGQEVATQGYSNVNSVVGASNNGFYTGRGSGVRQGIEVFDGPQTPKPTQPSVELWVPLLFWFNKDPRLAIPSVSIPYGQRYINVDFAAANLVLQQMHAFNPSLDSPGTNPVNSPDITTCELWINNIFVNPEIHDIFIKRIGFSLIRVHRLQDTRLNTGNDQVLLNQLKWPIETIYFGIRPITQIDPTNSLLLTGWDMYSNVSWGSLDLCGLQNAYSFASLPGTGPIECQEYSQNFVSFTGLGLDFYFELTNTLGQTLPNGDATVLTGNQVNAALMAGGYPPLNFTSPVPTTPTEAQILAALPSISCPASYLIQTPSFETLQIEAHGVPLYKTMNVQFFNSYIPYTYGGVHINTPFDIGAYMVTFNLYPGSYQPSGHVNISRAREFYFIYTSAEIGTNTIPQADLSIVAIAINFLLISDGSAVLRYST